MSSSVAISLSLGRKNVGGSQNNTKVWEKQTVVLVYFVVECHELNELNQLRHPPSRLWWNNGSCFARTPTNFPAIQICRHGMGAQSWKKNGFCLDSSNKNIHRKI